MRAAPISSPIPVRSFHEFVHVLAEPQWQPNARCHVFPIDGIALLGRMPEEPGQRMRTPARNSTVAIHANVVHVHGIDVDCSLGRQRDAGYLLHSIIVINARTFRIKSQPTLRFDYAARQPVFGAVSASTT